MILNIQWIRIAIVASIIVPFAESIQISYSKYIRKIWIECIDSGLLNDMYEPLEHSKLIDDSAFSSDWINATRVTFDLSCDVPYIPQKFLKHFLLLETLVLGSNHVQSIKSEDFIKNKNLKEMDFESNDLTQLSGNLFSHTPQIVDVNFANNKIIEIDPNTFAKGVCNLKVIDLHGNLIKTLHKNLFAKVMMLETLDVRNNKIVQLNCNILPSTFLGNNATINIQGNPLEIDFNCSVSGSEMVGDNSSRNVFLLMFFLCIKSIFLYTV